MQVIERYKMKTNLDLVNESDKYIASKDLKNLGADDLKLPILRKRPRRIYQAPLHLLGTPS